MLVNNHPQLRGLCGSEIFTFSDAMHTITVKLRPGVRQFLARMAELFELQVDTKGTRAYAARIVAILDPSGKLFGDRIVSRCDAAMRVKQSTAWLHRALQDDSMVLIVDDREDMWPGARNLVVVEPYHFWGRELGEEVNNRAGAAIAAAGPPPAPAAAPAGGLSAAAGSIKPSTVGGVGAGVGTAASTSPPAAVSADSSAADASAEYDPLQHAHAAGLAMAAPAASASSADAVALAAEAPSEAPIGDAAALEASSPSSAAGEPEAPLVGSKRSRGQMLAELPPTPAAATSEPGSSSDKAPADATAAASGAGLKPSEAATAGAGAMAVDASDNGRESISSRESADSSSSSVSSLPGNSADVAPAAAVAAAASASLPAAAAALPVSPAPQQHWAMGISPAELAARWCAEPPYAEQLNDVSVLLARAHAQYYRLHDQQQGPVQGQLQLNRAAAGGAGAATSSSSAGSAASSSGSSAGAAAASSASAFSPEETAPLVSPATIAADAAALAEILLDDPSLGRSATKVAASAATAAAAAGAGAGAGAAAADPATAALAKQFRSGSSSSSSSSASSQAQQHPQQLPMDTSAILQGLYRSVLRGVCVVFSGVFPLDVDAQRQLLYQRCLAFGACVADGVEPKLVHGFHFRREAAAAAVEVSNDSAATAAASCSTESGGTVAAAGASLSSAPSTDGSAASDGLHSAAAAVSASSGSSSSNGAAAAAAALPGARREFNGSVTSLGAVVTHIVARRAGTQKIHDAVLRPGISVVGLSWLTDSINRFARQPEAPHALDTAHQRYAAPAAGAAEARAASLRALLRNPCGSTESAGSSAVPVEAQALLRKAGTDTAADGAVGAGKADPASAAASTAAADFERSVRRRIDADDADEAPSAAALPAAAAAAADAGDLAASASGDDAESSSHGGGSSPGLSLHDSDWEDAEPLDL